MDAPLLSALSPASVNLSSSPDAASASAPQTMRGADFANLLGHLMSPDSRQDLAAAGLQTLPIGPQIEVITVAEPLPDADSLAAFARGQGLDEATVQALFGSSAPGGPPSAGMPSGGWPSLTGAATMADQLMAGSGALGQLGPTVTARQGEATEHGSAAGTLVSAALALGGLRPLLVQSPFEQAAGLIGQGAEPSAATASDEVVLQQSLALATGAIAPALTGAAAPSLMGRGQAMPAKASADPGKAALAGSVTQAGGAAILGPGALEGARVSQLSWQLQAATQSAPGALDALDLDPAAAAASAALSDVKDEALPEVMRLRLAPSEFITQRLAAMAGTGEQATWGSVAGQSASAAGLLRLDMRGLNLVTAASSTLNSGEAAGPVDSQALEQPATGGAQTAVQHETSRQSHTGAATSTATPWASTAAQRAEQYAQLAQRLGEALAQRLQSQIERGQWKVQMRLDPAHLGRIDLSLDMSAGGLDAVFRSDNQITRDLIAQGLPRLRDSLSQSGTAVANVWVQGDSNRQSGGNPTPGRAPDRDDEKANGRRAGSEEQLATPAVTRPRRGSGAWDVLA